MPRHQALEEETSPSSFSSHSDPATYPYPSLIYLCIELRALGMLGKSSIPSSRYLFSPRDFFTRDMSGSDPPQYSVSDRAVGDPVEGTALFSVGTFTRNSREV